MDYAHEQTDRVLEELEKKIKRIYSKLSKDLQKELNSYLERFIKQDENKRKQAESGEITQQEYITWRANYIAKGEEYTIAVKKSAEIAYNTNFAASEIINGKLPKIYLLNLNYVSYLMETNELLAGFKFGFVNENTIIRLLKDNPELFPTYKLIKQKDIKYNIQKIRESIISGLLQGKSINKIAKDLQNIANMNRNSAILHAQTAVTGAENAGRQQGFENAKEMGVKFKRKWISTLDSRTRHSHRVLDGQLRDVDKPFDSPLGEIMYPGDINANPANVWRCRCSLGVQIEGITEQGKRRARNENTGENEVIPYMTYQEWERKQHDRI